MSHIQTRSKTHRQEHLNFISKSTDGSAAEPPYKRRKQNGVTNEESIYDANNNGIDCDFTEPQASNSATKGTSVCK